MQNEEIVLDEILTFFADARGVSLNVSDGAYEDMLVCVERLTKENNVHWTPELFKQMADYTAPKELRQLETYQMLRRVMTQCLIAQ
jgi:hypothetical protein